ncbi:N-acetyl-gamma-glutamyl-phosphate reductase [Halothiobacillus neapolitanus]|uniref:N-acetyl-gamma-glutamyl-phosphate reductase n=1 Tax=Halothiobacillus neapolitanus (strain ATCC 23641 / DSM 15147 / CIP 104769 / NCIMB 8539 / c2) TaxID=555778 RepID=D0KW57_HALNC|nr:N-acetyl-gamma-glutamyl-phosphate reductase [Halothiobacillus neapolitanus]ACX96960.1 N-acetyl-gamma-glutamyl-phosphate reductase [Halothiobacillus neapolitanus c2]TDN59823.1 N-acetyl-gamma-glutamyl-phosphate reductase [Halothiobacillus neapolitanus]
MKKIGIVGGTGYTGVELMRLLARHGGVEITAITSRGDAGSRVDAMYPNLRGAIDLCFTAPDEANLADCDLVFFATPNGIAMQQAPELLAQGVKVIDLAADYRIKDLDVWSKWYGMSHASPDWVERAVYGLPELYRDEIRDAELVANPGCHVTATTLGLLPLMGQAWVDHDRLVADSKSGTSGAGRKAEVPMLMAEAGESFKAYSANGHRHQPEIVQTLAAVAERSIGLTFVPHLIPMVRGIEVSLYIPLVGEPTADVQQLYEAYYDAEPFVDVMPPGSHPETRSVRGNNLCRMAIFRPQGAATLVISSVIDNLVKGAAGQAVQNMNLMLGFPEQQGLDLVALSP